MNIFNAGRQAAREHCQEQSKPKLWVSTKFTGFYPVGVSALVYETTAERAADALNEALKARGLRGDASPESMVCLINLEIGHVHILQDGNY